MAGYGAILQAVGSVVQGIGSKAGAEMTADQIRMQRYMTHINERFVDMSKTLKVKEIDQAQKQLEGTQTAIIGRSGVVFDGSPAEVVLQSNVQFEKEKISADIEAKIQKLQLFVDRGSLELQEKQTRKAGTLSLIGGLLQAGSSMGGK